MSIFIPSQTNLTEEILYNYAITKSLNVSDAHYLLQSKPKQEDELLFKTSNKVTTDNVGNNVNLRAIIEFSNVCEADCLYCGIRKSNSKADRFVLDRQVIIDTAKLAIKQYPGLLLQSGEVQNNTQIDWLCSIIKEIKQIAQTESKMKENFRIIISVGELTEQQYQKLKDAGADRYLLRIETTNQQLFKKIHDQRSSFYERQNCLKILKKLNFHIGTGVLIGLPDQTLFDLVRDIFYFKKIGADMIGMGPFLPAKNTPMGVDYNQKQIEQNLHSENLFETVKRVIAVTRLANPRSNISATTAMEALAPRNGRSEAIFCGANVVMPVLTPANNKKKYSLYEGKSDVSSSLEVLREQIKLAGREMNLDVTGDPKTWLDRQNK